MKSRNSLRWLHGRQTDAPTQTSTQHTTTDGTPALGSYLRRGGKDVGRKRPDRGIAVRGRRVDVAAQPGSELLRHDDNHHRVETDFLEAATTTDTVLGQPKQARHVRDDPGLDLCRRARLWRGRVA